MSFTNAQLAQQIANLIEYWAAFNQEYSDWIGGTVSGGPNLDGEYPLTNWAGEETLLPCPALLSDNVTGYVATVAASASAASDSEIAAALSETNAAASAVTATAQAVLADADRVAAELAETGAVDAKVTAIAQAAAAVVSAAAALASEQAAAASEAAAAISETNAAASAAAAATFDPALYAALADNEIITGNWTFAQINPTATQHNFGPSAGADLPNGFLDDANSALVTVVNPTAAYAGDYGIHFTRNVDNNVGWSMWRDTSAGDLVINHEWNSASADIVFRRYTTDLLRLEGDGAVTIPGTLAVTGAVTGSNLAVANWNTAYGWGDHAGLYLGLTAKAADSALLNGYADSTVADVNTIVRRDAGGYVRATYFNQTGAATASTASNIMVEVGTDNFLRWQSIANFLSNHNIVATTDAAWNATDWDTAFGWGDHASGGYAPTASPTFTGNVSMAGALNNIASASTSYVTRSTAGSASLELHGTTAAFIDMSLDGTGGTDYGVRLRYLSDYLSIDGVTSIQINNVEWSTTDIANHDTAVTLSNSALQNVVEDVSPQLGSNLDLNGFEITTTNHGNAGTQTLWGDASSTPAVWSALPMGYSTFVRSTAANSPVANYGYFTKVSSRDSGGAGWGGLWVGYSADQNYVGRSQDGTSNVWEKLYTSSTFDYTDYALLAGQPIFTDGITVNGTVDNDVLIRFEMDRDWQFMSQGEDAANRLELHSFNDKQFLITDSLGVTQFSFDTNVGDFTAIGQVTGNAASFTGGTSSFSTLNAGNIDSTGTITASSYFKVDASSGNGLGFWGGAPTTYGIYMSSAGTQGRVTGDTTSDYNQYFEMNSGTNRGFVFETDGAKLFGINPDSIRAATNLVMSDHPIEMWHGGNEGTDYQRTIYKPKGAMFRADSSNQSGAFLITMPTSTPNTAMVTMIVKGYDYSSHAGWAIELSFYEWTTGWVNRGVSVLYGHPPFDTVQFQYDTATEQQFYIQLGDDTLTSNFQYPQIWVEQVTYMYSAQDTAGLSDNWSITRVTNETGRTTEWTYALLGHHSTGAASYDFTAGSALTAINWPTSATHNMKAINLATDTHLTQASANGELQVQTDHGYIQIGPKNASWCHMYTDRAAFYFDSPITIVGSFLPSATSTYSLGGSSQYWVNAYIQNIQLNSTDTTLSRLAAGKLGVEGKAVIKHTGSYTSGEVTFSTSAPSGGSSGDVWYQYT